MAFALSIRIPPEIEQRLELEVARLNTTKSKYVQDLLRQSLTPIDPVALLIKIRKDHGIPTPPPSDEPRTDRSMHVKALARQAVARKHNRILQADDGDV